jgi:tetratricopeptide (TPR) repeat protein
MTHVYTTVSNTLLIKDISINNEMFRVNEDEYNKINHAEYSNLRILDSLGFHERLISLLTEISSIYPQKVSVRMNHVTHGGFIPIKCSPFFQSIYIRHNHHFSNITYNAQQYLKNQSNLFLLNDIVPPVDDWFDIHWDHPNDNILISLNSSLPVDHYVRYELSNLSTEWTPQPTLYIYVSKPMHDSFHKHFYYYINNHILDYDNLIHLCVMVKNGGAQFETMLKKNMPIVDRWTILDTGSTDQTIEMIHNTLVGTKKGELYQEPFVNFKVSRNRCLDLAGKSCKFIIMLDDTYVVNGDLRRFLNIVRGDQFSTSFTLFIQSDDTEYGSNRIIKSDSGLRYIYRIHEVITDKENRNVVIPSNSAKIIDGRFDYMEERTMKRKELDLKLLYEEVEEDPSNPRSYYYLAQTYNLLENYEKAFEFFMKRCEFINSGFLQERVDAAFEAARIANFKLNKPWNECLQLYERAFKIDESRPESQYFIGIHYFLENNYFKAYHYFKKAFEIGYPSHCQYSLKPTLSFHFLPKFLARTCYSIPDYPLGEQASLFFLQNNPSSAEDYSEIASWYKIYQYLNKYNNNSYIIPKKSNKPLFVFVADGGFHPWSGTNILTTGVGGSETYIIEMARYIQKSGHFDVIVFCNCNQNEIFENVQYKHLNEYFSFINENCVHTCIISRYSEYLPVTYKGLAENVYLVVHDLTPSGNVIPIDSKLRHIFCLTEWHVEYMKERFSSLSPYLVPFYYGIDTQRFLNKNKIQKNSYQFIYSSFPNRGLLPLLQMWPHIYQNYPQASLHIYSDVNGKWVNEVAPDHMREIRNLLVKYQNKNIVYHGWVDKQTLANAWHTADIWFYPCIFMETFCLTALEAATTKTLAITNDLAALQNTVGNRGVVIKGDPMTTQWQTDALQQLFYYMDPLHQEEKRQLINSNYEWAEKLTWKNQADRLLKEYTSPPISLSPPNKNLIFLTIFQSEYLTRFYLLLHSIHLYGNLDHNNTHLLIYTTTELSEEIKKTFPFFSTFTIHFIINNTITTLEQSNKAHYDFFNLPYSSNYHNIIYLDNNTLINNNLNHIFQLCKEDKLYALSNYTINNELDYWGKSLFAKNELESIEDKRGIYSSMLLFKNSKTMRQLFKTITDDMNSRKEFNSFKNGCDIPYLNYHSITNHLLNCDLLSDLCSHTNNSDDLLLNKYIIHFHSSNKYDFNNNYKIMFDFFNKRKMSHIDSIRHQTYQAIQQYTLPLALSFKTPLEGSLFNDHCTTTTSSTYRDKQINICNILLTNKIDTILEIGFNAGFSTLFMLLSHPTVKITCVDLAEHSYTQPCYEWISKQFPDRIELISGNSCNILPELIKKQQTYDFIHIDGGHGYRTVFSDIHNSLKLSHKNTLLLMDDFEQPHICALWSSFILYFNLKPIDLCVQTSYHHLCLVP